MLLAELIFLKDLFRTLHVYQLPWSELDNSMRCPPQAKYAWVPPHPYPQKYPMVSSDLTTVRCQSQTPSPGDGIDSESMVICSRLRFVLSLLIVSKGFHAGVPIRSIKD
jgi:hypothetical protein